MDDELSDPRVALRRRVRTILHEVGDDKWRRAKLIAKRVAQLTTLCGIKSDQTEADFSYGGLNVGDAILLAFDLKKNSVLVSLKCVPALKPKNVLAFVSAPTNMNFSNMNFC